jgi:hypothetical protein
MAGSGPHVQLAPRGDRWRATLAQHASGSSAILQVFRTARSGSSLLLAGFSAITFSYNIAIARKQAGPFSLLPPC